MVNYDRPKRANWYMMYLFVVRLNIAYKIYHRVCNMTINMSSKTIEVIIVSSYFFYCLTISINLNESNRCILYSLFIYHVKLEHAQYVQNVFINIKSKIIYSTLHHSIQNETCLIVE